MSNAPKRHGVSIRSRLLAHARANGDEFQRVLTRYGIERLLYRLTRTEAGERYVLKGAMLFATWPRHALRPTGDLDLLGHGSSDADAVVRLFSDVCRVEFADDGVVFDPATLRAEQVREADEYHGLRLRLRADLAGAGIPLQVDIGFGDRVHPAPLRRDFPGLLPGLPVPNLLMYPPETVIAEKFAAMLSFGEANSRIKDFYDIWMAARMFAFDLPVLVEAVDGTLRRRRMRVPEGLPIGLTQAFAEVVEGRGLWTGFVRRTGGLADMQSFEEVQVGLRRFLGPVIAALARPEAARGHWDPAQGGWREPGRS